MELNYLPMDAKEALETFKGHLKSTGQRFTPERKVILDTVLKHKSHFSAESLVGDIRKKNKHVSLATVYRTLPVLKRCGFVQSTVKQGDVEYYERFLGDEHHHDHLLCASCGKIVEFYNEIIENEQTKVAEMHGFTLETHSLVLRGKCAKCRQ